MPKTEAPHTISVPNFDPVLDKVDSKFALITVVAKRASQLTNGARPLVDSLKVKPVSIALEEIAADKVKYHSTPDKHGDRLERLNAWQG
ncbi:MAG TPA: DNA-directed RNA polymerase subunit omega [Candidatus Xenobia bacterium]|jgi:DNA-directed RNA polymerase subunit omega